MELYRWWGITVIGDSIHNHSVPVAEDYEEVEGEEEDGWGR